ncbi:hypothetical protein SEEN2TTA_17701, partial [Salmonella enterica subsp. enterica serovar Newport str. Pond080-2TTA]
PLFQQRIDIGVHDVGQNEKKLPIIQSSHNVLITGDALLCD